MYLYQRIYRAIRNKFRRKKRNFFLDLDTLNTVQIVAAREKREPEEIAGKLLEDMLRSRQEQEKSWGLWETLSPREQDVAALICLGYTTRQIAAKLHIAPETVKTHVQKALLKFRLHNRYELRILLKDWDFSEWEHPSE